MSGGEIRASASITGEEEEEENFGEKSVRRIRQIDAFVDVNEDLDEEDGGDRKGVAEEENLRLWQENILAVESKSRSHVGL